MQRACVYTIALFLTGRPLPGGTAAPISSSRRSRCTHLQHRIFSWLAGIVFASGAQSACTHRLSACQQANSRKRRRGGEAGTSGTAAGTACKAGALCGARAAPLLLPRALLNTLGACRVGVLWEGMAGHEKKHRLSSSTTPEGTLCPTQRACSGEHLAKQERNSPRCA